MTAARSSNRIVPYPVIRRVMEMMQRSAMRVPMIHGLVEFDVTDARLLLHAQEAATGERISFTAFIACCLAQAVAADRSVQALRKGLRKLEISEDIDISIPVERDIAGDRLPVIAVLRAAQTKTVLDLHHEIRAAQTAPIAEVWEGYSGFSALPLWVIRLIWPAFWWLICHTPRLQRRFGGTVGISAVGMFANGAGWGLPIANRTQLTLGGIAKKPGIVGDQIAVREFLSVTMSFDHAIIDGGNAARFAARLKELIESAHGLGAPAPLTADTIRG